MDKMDGMVALVTGTSRGLGRAIAKEYAREGATVAICARHKSPTGLTGTIGETAAEIQGLGGEVFTVSCDITDEDQVSNMVRQVIDRYGRIDVLVNNAGAMALGHTILEISPSLWDQIFAANVRGALFGMPGRPAPR